MAGVMHDVSYESFYRHFDSPLMHAVRREAYGEDIGQHSWVTARDLRQDIARLGITASSRVLDLGCGPGGPLTFIARATGCQATGLDLSGAALQVATTRASSLGVSERVITHQHDLNAPLPFAARSFDAAVCFDAVIHVADRSKLFLEVARVLTPRGRFMFTDAAVITGSVSSEQLTLRSVHGPMQFVSPGFNERGLEQTGFRLLKTEDRTERLAKSAAGRLTARRAHRDALVELEGADQVVRHEQYLATVIALAESRSLSRFMYLAERSAA